MSDTVCDHDDCKNNASVVITLTAVDNPLQACRECAGRAWVSDPDNTELVEYLE